MLHPWICTYELEKPHQALGISWEGRNNAELLGRIPAQEGSREHGGWDRVKTLREHHKEQEKQFGVLVFVVG